MAAGTQSRGELDPGPESVARPAVFVCESRPGKAVFIETGNTDAWIASDRTLEVTQ